MRTCLGACVIGSVFVSHTTASFRSWSWGPGSGTCLDLNLRASGPCPSTVRTLPLGSGAPGPGTWLRTVPGQGPEAPKVRWRQVPEPGPQDQFRNAIPVQNKVFVLDAPGPRVAGTWHRHRCDGRLPPWMQSFCGTLCTSTWSGQVMRPHSPLVTFRIWGRI